ncbi:MAG: hypothetical protein ACRDRH_05035 [Pseudonocardia sp.]
MWGPVGAQWVAPDGRAEPGGRESAVEQWIPMGQGVVSGPAAEEEEQTPAVHHHRRRPEMAKG